MQSLTGFVKVTLPIRYSNGYISEPTTFELSLAQDFPEKLHHLFHWQIWVFLMLTAKQAQDQPSVAMKTS